MLTLGYDARDPSKGPKFGTEREKSQLSLKNGAVTRIDVAKPPTSGQRPHDSKEWASVASPDAQASHGASGSNTTCLRFSGVQRPPAKPPRNEIPLDTPRGLRSRARSPIGGQTAQTTSS